MRKILFSLLLATAAAATPAFAEPTDDKRAQAVEERAAARQQAHAERQANHDQARPEAAGRGQSNFQPARPNFVPQEVAPEARANVDRQQWSRPAYPAQSGDRHGFDGRNSEQRQWSRPAPNAEQNQSRYQGQANGDSVANWRQQQRDQMRQDRYGQDSGYARSGQPAYARPDRSAPVPQTAYNYDQRRSPQWSTNWRNDRRYDWRDYRERHRSTFRLGIYYDPFGWGYQRYDIGRQLYPAYYGQNYWLTDPYMYDLPYAPWPLQWVRYYDDALLVNVFTGQVVDVMYDFFW